MNRAQPQTSQSPAYLETFGMHVAPFGDQLDDRFFYAGDPLMQRLDLLGHLTHFGDSAVLVSGPAGSGKTTLLRRFISETSDRWNICQLDGSKFEQATKQFADALGGDSNTAPETLLDEWQARTDPRHLLTIVIDNADQLQPADIEQLGRLLNSPCNDRVRMILFGTRDTEHAVDESRRQGLFPDTLQRLEMPRLSEEEASSYLMYRLAVAGYSGESPFSATEIRAICKAAGGRPGEINQLAHESLLERQARLKHGRIPSGETEKKRAGLAWLAAATAVLSLIAYLGWQHYSEDQLHQPTLLSDNNMRMTEQPLQLPQPAPVPAPSTESFEQFDSMPIDRLSENFATAALIPEALQITPPTAEDNTDTQPRQDALSADVSATDELAATAAESPAAITATEAQHSVTSSTSAESADTKGGAPVTSPPASQPVTVEPATTAPEAPVPPKTQAVTTEAGGPHRETWLLDQPASSYTLQLLGSRNEKSISDFIRRHQLDPDKSAWYQAIYKGADWYVLVYGIYADRESAIADRDRLPALVRKEKPWPRKTKAVQQVIRERAGH